eukprot:TRINITY_DN26122_c0_g1_i1.p1 TRINITY_DN26122_c0_g1~~TRINITY_DN26122_c0_g1_i1.p1  ORF type:complete len:396 (-),score=53.81 TRINITY_DN26122_c0_g1_i1:465-1652(-)
MSGRARPRQGGAGNDEYFSTACRASAFVAAVGLLGLAVTARQQVFSYAETAWLPQSEVSALGQSSTQKADTALEPPWLHAMEEEEEPASVEPSGSTAAMATEISPSSSSSTATPKLTSFLEAPLSSTVPPEIVHVLEAKPSSTISPVPVEVLAPQLDAVGCLVHMAKQPKPVVFSPDGAWLELSFLNSDVKEGFKTSPKCSKPWDSDEIGRPIVEPTETLLKRAVRVGHPKNGMLSPKSPISSLKHCSRPVPKIIHFVWICSPLAGRHAERIQGFAKNNPHYKVFLWLDETMNSTSKDILKQVSTRPAGPVEIKDVYAEAQTFQSLRVIKHLDAFHENNRHPGVCALKSHFLRLEAGWMGPLVQPYRPVYLGPQGTAQVWRYLCRHRSRFQTRFR